MTIPFSPWPAEVAKQYRDKGYWMELPLHSMLHEYRHSEAHAILCGDRSISYAQLDTYSSNLAKSLLAEGLGPGDTALVQLPNVAEFYVVYFALLKAGIAPVNALFNHQKLELTEYARQLQPRLLVACSDHALFSDADFYASLCEMAPVKKCLILGDSEFAENLNESIYKAPVDAPELPKIDPSHVAFFQLSGGSTGTPKLIPRTHNDYFYSVRCSVEICKLSHATRFLVALPAAHNFPMSSPGALGVLSVRGTLIMAATPEPLNCFEIIAKHQVSMTALVPSAVILWLNAAQQHKNKLNTLKLLQVGGANFSEATARRIPNEFGCRLQQVFGMAEGLVNYTRLNDDPEIIFTTQGRPMSPDDEIKIVDEAGEEVAPGETGQLLTRGPYTFRGYFKAPEHNARVFDDEGFYYSGDLVQATVEGNLKVVGRVKDQINRGGEKIAAEEIESLLLRHPEIINAALIAVPDSILGEKSCACLITDSKTLKAFAVRKFLRNQGLAEFKLPDAVRILEDFPLTAVGKINKKSLRKLIGNSQS